MNANHAEEFLHTTAPHYPDAPRAVVFVGEGSDHIGVYLMDDCGQLWPARTVHDGAGADIEARDRVLNAWASGPTPCIDVRDWPFVDSEALKKLYQNARADRLRDELEKANAIIESLWRMANKHAIPDGEWPNMRQSERADVLRLTARP